MYIVYFTNESNLSSDLIGYFPYYPSSLAPLDDIYITPSSDIATLDGTRTVSSYIYQSILADPGPAPTTWNFSGQSEYLIISESYVNTAGGFRFNGDTFNLGEGSDFLDFNLDSYEGPYLSTVYTFTINAGNGNDKIYVENGGEIGLLRPLAKVRGDDGNDRIYILYMPAIVFGDSPISTNPGYGADFITTDYFSDRIYGGAGPDIIASRAFGDFIETGEAYPEALAYEKALMQKDLITGNAGRDTFRLEGDAYGLNGANDFGFITDFSSGDRISTIYDPANLLIDNTDGSLALSATSTYSSQTRNYTARLLLDSDGSGTITTGDELLLYLGGYQPTIANLVYSA